MKRIPKKEEKVYLSKITSYSAPDVCEELRPLREVEEDYEYQKWCQNALTEDGLELSVRAMENRVSIAMANPPDVNMGNSCAYTLIVWGLGGVRDNTLFIAPEDDPTRLSTMRTMLGFLILAVDICFTFTHESPSSLPITKYSHEDIVSTSLITPCFFNDICKLLIASAGKMAARVVVQSSHLVDLR